MRPRRPAPRRVPSVRRSDAPYPRICIAALSSSVGKTSVSAMVLSEIRRSKKSRAAFKCGPDFLDPQVLRAAGGLAAVPNLDLWLTGPEQVLRSLAHHGAPRGPGLNLLEGVMGLFDTSSWGTSTADLARLTRTPIVLVVDAARSAESVAALVRGARTLLPRGALVGVIVNRAGAGWHSRTVRMAVEQRGRVRVLGVVPWSEEVALPEQHLGLTTPDTSPNRSWDNRWAAMAGVAREYLDLDGLLSLAEKAPPLPTPPPRSPPRSEGPGAHVAVASDAAFCFTYPENLEALAERGARLVPFSPIRGDPLPARTDAIVLPGGYPELHARALAENDGLRREIRAWVKEGRPLYAECGGMMYLLDELVDLGGRRHRMVGAFPGRTRMGRRLAGFGYVEARLRRGSLLGRAGERLRGHLFHHSFREACGAPRWAWEFRPRSGGRPHLDGYVQGACVAGYLHIRWDQAPRLLSGLVPAELRGVHDP